MEDQDYQLFVAIDEGDLDTATGIVASGMELNTVRDDLGGVPALFVAVLKGNLEMVQLLLDNGADPNFRVDESAAAIYAEKPLDLAAKPAPDELGPVSRNCSVAGEIRRDLLGRNDRFS